MPAVYASTSPQWFAHLAALQPVPTLVAFWRPTDSAPTNIAPGEAWFFKEWGAPRVLGYGRFVERERTTPVELWSRYGRATGAPTQEALLASIGAARKGAAEPDTTIGNIILSDFSVFDPPLSLNELDLPNLPVPYRYVPAGNRLLDLAEAPPLRLTYNEPLAPMRQEVQREIFARNDGHVAHIRRLYGGRCQVSGEPVLAGLATDLTHVHHINFLCAGGVDHPSNMIALSPNWHAIAHAPGTAFDWATLEFVVGEQRYGLALNRHLTPRQIAARR
ncbi:HNH endonuclease signature motif containing protein [Azospirillum sp. TSO22-1]|uniref:HNH endonuclease signature motif containing protein n=1 Tax=Azospirillum sp. TSO22-1 TaxID=716789 RepID=UPI0011B3C2A3|nr:HNH endonuclease signature motif containing protein [Azospirillum sp. TSO22-1]